LIISIVSVELTSEKMNASLATVAAGEWATVSEGSIFALDVRLTLKTDDGEYTGRGDGATGLIAASPTFQTGSEKYKWLNRVQAVSAGNVNLGTGELVYQLYEVKVTL